MRCPELFVKTDTTVVRISDISYVDYANIADKRKVIIFTNLGDMHTATGILAIEVLMKIMPSALEGKRLMWNKLDWCVHNVIAHPIMQILAFFKMYKMAFWVHDFTIPKPKGFKDAQE